jgi:pullulanase/glycogen debranching enzyme
MSLLGAAAAAGKTQLSEASQAICNAPLGHQVLTPSALKLPASAIWQNKQQILVSADALGLTPASAPSTWRLLSAPQGSLKIETGQVASGFEQALTLQASSPQLLNLPALTDAKLRKLHASQLVLVQEDTQGRVQSAMRIQSAKALDELFAPAAFSQTLGVQLNAGKNTGGKKAAPVKGAELSLWAPTARAVSVCIYPNAQAAAVAHTPLKLDEASGVWRTQSALAKPGTYYRYAVEVFVPGMGWVLNHVNDPYAVSLSANSLRSYVADLNAPQLKPAGWDQHRAPQTVKHAVEMVIYELHVRDFSINDTTVPAELRGKYVAFTQGQSQGMQHLKALAKAGMTDLHLLPVFDLATVPEKNCQSDARSPQTTRANDCFNWGYDPLHFNAPEGSYATDADDGAKRILEFRRMVKSLHEAGWRVGMDMVYNHTSASGQHAQSVLDRVVPGYYQRLNAQGEVERSTCCDNTATENLMMAKLMSDSMLLWTQQYKLDSFRFDLMGHQPKQVMVDIQNRLQKTLRKRIDFVGEGWNFGEVANGARFVQASQLSLNGTGIGTFNDRLRDAIRGGGAGDAVENLMKVPGFVSGRETSGRVADQIRAGLAGSLRNYRMATADGTVQALQNIPYGDQPTGYVSQPSEVVNYAENHDNLTLFDSLAYKLPRGTSSAERARVQMLAGALVAKAWRIFMRDKKFFAPSL